MLIFFELPDSIQPDTVSESSAFYFFFSPCPTNRSTAITAPYRMPAIAQMNQLYFACALPYGPKV